MHKMKIVLISPALIYSSNYSFYAKSFNIDICYVPDS